MRPVVLVVAKAPLPGAVKTRLIGPLTADQAADLATAALLDTLAAARGVPGAEVVLALSGDPAAAGPRVGRAVRACRLLPQRGATFADRLVSAHLDAGGPDRAVLQIGMDTPQVTADVLAAGLDALRDAPAVLGPAPDGGWWALGLNDPRHARCLRGVPLSTSRTGMLTVRSLRELGAPPALLPGRRDVDTWADALHVADLAPGSRFAAAVAAIRATGRVAA